MENTPTLDSIYNIQSIHGVWNDEVEVYRDVDPGPPFIEHAYFFVGLEYEGVGIPLRNYQETLLFTFQTTQVCPDILALFDSNTNLNYNDFINMNRNPRMDLAAFNTSTGDIYNWLGNYGHYAYDCKDCDNDGIPNGIEDEDGNIYVICDGYNPADSLVCDFNYNDFGGLGDSDGDGLTDCEEITGVNNPNTPISPPHDGDGLTSDPFNICDPIAVSTLDSDGDGLTDCEENTGMDNPNTPAIPLFDEDGPTSDMWDINDPFPTFPVENCFDGLDNDGDGLIDDLDFDCIANCNLLLNGSFIDGLNNWGNYVEAGTRSTISIPNIEDISSPNSAYVDISQASGIDWHLILGQTNLELISGETYKVRIEAKADANRTVLLVLQLGYDPFTTYWSQNINLTTTSQIFEFDSIAPYIDDTNINFLIMYGDDSTNFWIDNVALQKSNCTSTDVSENCFDGIDNDGDGFIDCEDGNCGQPTIHNITQSISNNCLTLNDATLTIDATGNNLEYSLTNGFISQKSNVFTGLAVGIYDIMVINSKTKCSVSQAVTITPIDTLPSPITVDLGSPQVNCTSNGVTLTATVLGSLNTGIGGTCSGTSVSSFPYAESFENGMGDWSQPSNNEVNWITYRGAAGSAQSGPRGAVDGLTFNYLRPLESYDKMAILKSPCFDLGDYTIADFKFQYHMFGTDMGSLKVEASADNGGTWKSLWGLSGDQSDEWHTVVISLDDYTGGQVQLRFVGVTGSSYKSDIAIDDIQLLAEYDARFLETPTYSWNTGETTSSITVNPTTTTIYSVDVTLGGCTASDQVTVFGEPTIDKVRIISPTCSNLNSGSIIIDAIGDSLEYSIDNGTNFQFSNSFTGLNEGSYTIAVRIWTVVDECGNTSTCQTFVHHVDTEAPIISCAQDLTVSCEIDSLQFLFEEPTVFDDCNNVDLSYYDTTSVQTVAYESDLIRVWMATDECGNRSTCQQLISIVDTCQQIIIVNTEQTRVYAKLSLEGFYDPTTDKMRTTLKDNNLLPTYQPFAIAPWNYIGTDSVSNFPVDVVDWVLIMSRDSTGNVLDQSVGFINKEGALLATDGTFGIPLLQAFGNRISIHHCSHLAILSAVPYLGGVYDFTEKADAALGNQQLKAVAGKYMLYVGDYDASGIINSIDYNLWKLHSSLLHQYLPTDGDGNAIINNLDYNLWTKNKAKIGEQMIRY